MADKPSKAVDTSGVTEIEASPAKMAFLVVLGVFMTGISLAIALGLFGELRAGDFMIYIAWFGVAFFGLALFGAIRSMMTMNGVVVTLSPQGIRDIRISKEPIPWADIRDITTWSYRTQKLMVLKVDADTRKRRLHPFSTVDGISLATRGRRACRFEQRRQRTNPLRSLRSRRRSTVALVTSRR